MVVAPSAPTDSEDSQGRTAAPRTFNPCVIVLQILVLQAIYYVFLSFFCALGNWFFEVTPADFSAQLLGSAASGGERRIAALATIFASAGPCAVVLALLVQRARRCADHATTLLVAHIIICVSLHGLPHRPLWWFIQIGSTVLMSVVAENICRVIEAKQRSSFINDIHTESKTASSSSRKNLKVPLDDDKNDEEEVSLLVDEV